MFIYQVVECNLPHVKLDVVLGAKDQVSLKQVLESLLDVPPALGDFLVPELAQKLAAALHYDLAQVEVVGNYKGHDVCVVLLVGVVDCRIVDVVPARLKRVKENKRIYY